MNCLLAGDSYNEKNIIKFQKKIVFLYENRAKYASGKFRTSFHVMLSAILLKHTQAQTTVTWQHAHRQQL